LYFHVLDELKKRSPPLAPAAPPELMQKSPRNELCYCGSGKRFKHCHGKLT
jgi:preprotein translocase subunit SecA